MEEAIALLELDSIAAGFRTADAVAKRARVELLESRPLDPGKYLVLFGGEIASVESAFERGVEAAGANLVDRVFLPAPHETLAPLLRGERPDVPIDAIGVVETSAVASAVRAADAAAKAAPVRLLRVHLARRIGGKGCVVLTGELSDVEAAVAAASGEARREDRLVAEVVIPAPAAETHGKISGEWLA
ncbi:MAG: BMC domain-containing protein [Candidatus Eisenbacteria bacterium]|nr:BMC domain-containing protein [Candidatus Eisenbacteria bacterium]